MSYMRVLVLEVPSSIPWTRFMKIFRTTTEPELKVYKKQKIVAIYGAEKLGIAFSKIILQKENEKTIYFIDDDKKKQEYFFAGIKTLSLEKFEKINSEFGFMYLVRE